MLKTGLRISSLAVLCCLLPILATRGQRVCQDDVQECCLKMDGKVDSECLAALSIVLQDTKIHNFKTDGDPDELAELWLQQAVYLARAGEIGRVRPALEMALTHSWTDPARSDGEPFVWELKIFLAGSELFKNKAFEENIFLFSSLEESLRPWLNGHENARRLSSASKLGMAMAYDSLGLRRQALRLAEELIPLASRWGQKPIVDAGQKLLNALRIPEDDKDPLLDLATTVSPSLSPEAASTFDLISRVLRAVKDADRTQPAPESFSELLGDTSDLKGPALSLLKSLDDSLRASLAGEEGWLDNLDKTLKGLVPPSILFEAETRHALLSIDGGREPQGIEGLHRALRRLQTRLAHLASRPGLRGGIRKVDSNLFAEAVDALGRSDGRTFDYAEQAKAFKLRWQLGGEGMAQRCRRTL